MLCVLGFFIFVLKLTELFCYHSSEKRQTNRSELIQSTCPLAYKVNVALGLGLRCNLRMLLIKI